MKKVVVHLAIELEGVPADVTANELVLQVEGAIPGSDFAKRLWDYGNFTYSGVTKVTITETFNDIE